MFVCTKMFSHFCWQFAAATCALYDAHKVYVYFGRTLARCTHVYIYRKPAYSATPYHKLTKHQVRARRYTQSACTATVTSESEKQHDRNDMNVKVPPPPPPQHSSSDPKTSQHRFNNPPPPTSYTTDAFANAHTHTFNNITHPEPTHKTGPKSETAAIWWLG